MVKESPKEVDTALLVTAKNPRGIPEVVFIVSVSCKPSRTARWNTSRCPLAASALCISAQSSAVAPEGLAVVKVQWLRRCISAPFYQYLRGVFLSMFQRSRERERHNRARGSRPWVQHDCILISRERAISLACNHHISGSHWPSLLQLFILGP